MVADPKSLNPEHIRSAANSGFDRAESGASRFTDRYAYFSTTRRTITTSIKTMFALRL
jgi:hypothetical protein